MYHEKDEWEKFGMLYLPVNSANVLRRHEQHYPVSSSSSSSDGSTLWSGAQMPLMAGNIPGLPTGDVSTNELLDALLPQEGGSFGDDDAGIPSASPPPATTAAANNNPMLETRDHRNNNSALNPRATPANWQKGAVVVVVVVFVVVVVVVVVAVRCRAAPPGEQPLGY